MNINILSEEGVTLIPRLARLAFAVRCANRVLPIYEKWANEDREKRWNGYEKVKDAIAMGADTATFGIHGGRSIEQTRVRNGVTEKRTLYTGCEPLMIPSDPKAHKVNTVALAVSSASTEISSLHREAEVNVILRAIQACMEADEEASIKEMTQDFIFLYNKSQAEKWTDETKVPQDVFNEPPPSTFKWSMG